MLRSVSVRRDAGVLGIGRWAAPVGGVLARAAPEDERVEQRVGAEAVAAVHRDARRLARGVQVRDGRLAVDVGLDAAHDVVHTRSDVDRLAGDVDAREISSDVDDLPQGLERPAARHLRDVEGHCPVREAAPLVDLGLLGAGDDVAGGKLELVGGVAAP